MSRLLPLASRRTLMLRNNNVSVRVANVFSSRATPPLNEQRVTKAAIVGLPNAGKSSLLNALLAKRIAAVSKKRNTTRQNLLAVASDSVSGIQVAFYDTPGFVGHRQVSVGGEEKGRVERSVLTSARSAVADGNLLTLVVIDAAKKLTDTYQAQLRELLQNMVAEVLAREHLIHGEMRSGALARHLASCFTLVLNKVDLVNPKADLLPLTTDLVNMFNEVVWMEVSDWKKKRLKSRASLDVDVFMVSATASDAHTNGLADLRKYLHAASSVQAWDVDEEDKLLSRSSGDVYDDVNCELDDEEFASECIREKIFNFIHKEVPYRVKQVNRVWREEGGILQIQNDLVVKTRSHKKMLIGPKGEILQLITQSAQKDLSEHFGMPVRLTLWVRENTSKNG